MVDVSKVKTGDRIFFKHDQVLIDFDVLSVDQPLLDFYCFEFTDFNGEPNSCTVYKNGKDILGEKYGDIVKIEKRTRKSK